MSTINIKDDFSISPTLRHSAVSAFSGEDFYHEILNSRFKIAYERNEKLTIYLDGTEGYAPSFIDESFGNLVYDFTLDVVKEHLEVISIEEPYWLVKLENDTFVNWEKKRLKEMDRKVTKKHSAWYRLINNELVSKVWDNPSNSK